MSIKVDVHIVVKNVQNGRNMLKFFRILNNMIIQLITMLNFLNKHTHTYEHTHKQAQNLYRTYHKKPVSVLEDFSAIFCFFRTDFWDNLPANFCVFRTSFGRFVGYFLRSPDLLRTICLIFFAFPGPTLDNLSAIFCVSPNYF